MIIMLLWWSNWLTFLNSILIHIVPLFHWIPVDLCTADITPLSHLYCRQVLIDSFVPVKVEVLHERPYVIRLVDFVTPGWANTVAYMARPFLGPGQITYGDGKPFQSTERRALSGTIPKRGYEDIFLGRWLPRMSKVLGIRTVQPAAGLMNVIAYDTGGYYKLHLDSSEMRAPNTQRIATMVLYLRSPSKGGRTIFPRLNLAAESVTGDALFWYSHFTNSSLDEQTIHAGCAVTEGEKYISTLWIRNVSQWGPSVICKPGETYFKPYWL